MLHTKDDLTKPIHGVFRSTNYEVLNISDKAYKLILAKDRQKIFLVKGAQTPARATYMVDIGEQVGFIGGIQGSSLGNPATNWIRIVIENSNNNITIFPDSPNITPVIPIP